MSHVSPAVDAGLARIVIDHPPVNILTRELLRALRDDLARLKGELTLRALLITATGKHFSAGADVGEHLPPHHRQLIPEFLETVSMLDGFPVPVVAAVQGRCLGGGFELVLAADIVIAAEGASFGQPEILLGVAPPAAAAWLSERCARGLAAQLLFTGDPVSAAEAARGGLVRAVVPDADLEAQALALTSRITRHSAVALRETKHMMRARDRDAHDAALRFAGDAYLHAIMRTTDAVEGLRAFAEKRAPVWSHR
jgi:cyclohexa-1,5-dienecarbonyl-CoA hydratase